jgi:phage terminase large subunit GpA-like protein
MAINFLEAKKNPEMLKTWVNTSLGESWEEQGTTLDHEQLLERRLNYDIDSIPEKVLVIVAGCDTQADRIEITLTGYGRGYEAFVLDHRVLWGDPNAPHVWADLDELLRQRFKTESGRSMPISCTCVDSGGHSTNAVYEFTKPRQARRIFAIKGLSVAGKPIANKPSYVGKNKAVLYGIGTDTAKELIFSRLMTDLDKSTLHFPHNVDEDYFLQLTAEKRVTKFVRGRKSLVWKQIRSRNETLDCLVYCFAAAYILNPNWDLLEMKTLDGEVVEPNKDDSSPLIRRKTRRDTNFANNWKDI